MTRKITKAILTLLMICGTAMLAQAQNIVVRGVVTDKSTRFPLPGVNITIKGKAAGTSTGQNGSFSISSAESSFTLVFSYVGYTTVEQQISGSNYNLSI